MAVVHHRLSVVVIAFVTEWVCLAHRAGFAACDRQDIAPGIIIIPHDEVTEHVFEADNVQEDIPDEEITVGCRPVGVGQRGQQSVFVIDESEGRAANAFIDEVTSVIEVIVDDVPDLFLDS